MNQEEKIVSLPLPQKQVDGVTIRTIKTDSELVAVFEAGKVCGVAPLFPTHYVMKDDYIVGSMSLTTPPHVYFWTDKERVKSRDSNAIRNFFENFIALGSNQVILPVEKSSPFYKIVERLGYEKILDDVTIFRKDV